MMTTEASEQTKEDREAKEAEATIAEQAEPATEVVAEAEAIAETEARVSLQSPKLLWFRIFGFNWCIIKRKTNFEEEL